MKALSLTQPWATAVALGLKRVETRSWRTHYRGPIAIHAAKGRPDPWMQGDLPPGPLPLGAILATAILSEIVPTVSAVASGLISEDERSWGDYAPGRWAWFLENIEPLAEPVYVNGHLGLWEWTP